MLSEELTSMLTAFLQDLTVTSKGDVTGNEDRIKLGMKKGAPHSPILFLIYINGIHCFGQENTDYEVVENRMGKV